MKKLIWVTTVAQSMVLFRGQLHYMSHYFDLTFVASNEEDPNELFERGRNEDIKVHLIPMHRKIALFSDLRSLLAFVRYFRAVRPDIVHGNTPKGGLLSMLAALLTGVRVRIYMCHGLRYQGCRGLMRRLLMLMEHITCMCATHVLCVSDGVRQTLADDGICSLEKSKIIGNGSCNGINPEHYDPALYNVEDRLKLREQLGVSANDFILIYIGRIIKDKGVNELLEAYCRYRRENPYVRLVVLGSFEDDLNHVDAVTVSVIRNEEYGVVYCGRKEDIRPYLAMAQGLVLPSYREGFGLVLMEAGAMGKPVICTDIIGCNNVVTPDNGLMVEPRNSDALYTGMKRMIENHTLYKHISESTRSSIIKRFDQKTLWKKFLDFYESL